MQTVIQNQNAIRLGSIKLEVGASLGALVNVGALRGVSIKQKGVTEEVLFDNADGIKKYSDGNVFSFTAKLCEINWDNIQVMNDGQVSIVNNAGTLQTVTDEAHGTGWTVGQPIRLTFKNGNNTQVGAIVVEEDNIALVLNTDYRIYVSDGTNGVAGYTYIIPLTAQTGAITVSYTYTPNASKTVSFNPQGAKVGKYMRITNTDQNGKTMVMTLSGTTNVAPITIAFASDNDANVAEMDIELEGTVSELVDEQAA